MRDKQSLWGFFAHAGIIVGMMFVVFFVIDRFNPAMEFLTSSLSKWLILFLAVCAVGDGLYSAILLFQRQRRQEDRKRAQVQERSLPQQRVPAPNYYAGEGKPQYARREFENGSSARRRETGDAYFRKEPAERR